MVSASTRSRSTRRFNSANRSTSIRSWSLRCRSCSAVTALPRDAAVPSVLVRALRCGRLPNELHHRLQETCWLGRHRGPTPWTTTVAIRHAKPAHAVFAGVAPSPSCCGCDGHPRCALAVTLESIENTLCLCVFVCLRVCACVCVCLCL